MRDHTHPCRCQHLGVLLLLLTVLLPWPPMAAAAEEEAIGVGPITATNGELVVHAAYDPEDCSTCHEKEDPASPGGLNEKMNDLCFTCHDGIQEAIDKKHPHAAALEECTLCHNPHQARQPKLLRARVDVVCMECHDDVVTKTQEAAVQHGAASEGKRCVNCHNPHGSDQAKLLHQSPMELCLTCHGKDGLVDHDGKVLTNMKALLEENPEHHAPVAAEECSTCHDPHGHENFRLLSHEYPNRFYAPYDAKNYALCFECHDETLATLAQTDEATGFRDGRRNLHYVHVNKPARGRTCRACHEVHAAQQKHQIRSVVPYGPKNWPLKLHYESTPTGGSCQKTCHATRSYDREQPVGPVN